MKKEVRMIVLLLFTLSLLLLVSISNRVKIDCGTSALYSKDEMKDAIELIVREVSEWDGCKLCQIAYAGDQVSKEALYYCNQVITNQVYDEYIIFESSFSTTKDRNLAGPFEPDSIYTNWMWYLARIDGGKWEIITYGY